MDKPKEITKYVFYYKSIELKNSNGELIIPNFDRSNPPTWFIIFEKRFDSPFGISNFKEIQEIKDINSKIYKLIKTISNTKLPNESSEFNKTKNLLELVLYAASFNKNNSLLDNFLSNTPLDSDYFNLKTILTYPLFFDLPNNPTSPIGPGTVAGISLDDAKQRAITLEDSKLGIYTNERRIEVLKSKFQPEINKITKLIERKTILMQIDINPELLIPSSREEREFNQENQKKLISPQPYPTNTFEKPKWYVSQFFPGIGTQIGLSLPEAINKFDSPSNSQNYTVTFSNKSITNTNNIPPWSLTFLKNEKKNFWTITKLYFDSEFYFGKSLVEKLANYSISSPSKPPTNSDSPTSNSLSSDSPTSNSLSSDSPTSNSPTSNPDSNSGLTQLSIFKDSSPGNFVEYSKDPELVQQKKKLKEQEQIYEQAKTDFQKKIKEFQLYINYFYENLDPKYSFQLQQYIQLLLLSEDQINTQIERRDLDRAKQKREEGVYKFGKYIDHLKEKEAQPKEVGEREGERQQEVYYSKERPEIKDEDNELVSELPDNLNVLLEKLYTIIPFLDKPGEINKSQTLIEKFILLFQQPFKTLKDQQKQFNSLTEKVKELNEKPKLSSNEMNLIEDFDKNFKKIYDQNLKDEYKKIIQRKIDDQEIKLIQIKERDAEIEKRIDENRVRLNKINRLRQTNQTSDPHFNSLLTEFDKEDKFISDKKKKQINDEESEIEIEKEIKKLKNLESDDLFKKDEVLNKETSTSLPLNKKQEVEAFIFGDSSEIGSSAEENFKYSLKIDGSAKDKFAILEKAKEYFSQLGLSWKKVSSKPTIGTLPLLKNKKKLKEEILIKLKKASENKERIFNKFKKAVLFSPEEDFEIINLTEKELDRLDLTHKPLPLTYISFNSKDINRLVSNVPEKNSIFESLTNEKALTDQTTIYYQISNPTFEEIKEFMKKVDNTFSPKELEQLSINDKIIKNFSNINNKQQQIQIFYSIISQLADKFEEYQNPGIRAFYSIISQLADKFEEYQNPGIQAFFRRTISLLTENQMKNFDDRVKSFLDPKNDTDPNTQFEKLEPNRSLPLFHPILNGKEPIFEKLDPHISNSIEKKKQEFIQKVSDIFYPITEVPNLEDTGDAADVAENAFNISQPTDVKKLKQEAKKKQKKEREREKIKSEKENAILKLIGNVQANPKVEELINELDKENAEKDQVLDQLLAELKKLDEERKRNDEEKKSDIFNKGLDSLKKTFGVNKEAREAREQLRAKAAATKAAAKAAKREEADKKAAVMREEAAMVAAAKRVEAAMAAAVKREEATKKRAVARAVARAAAREAAKKEAAKEAKRLAAKNKAEAEEAARVAARQAAEAARVAARQAAEAAKARKAEEAQSEAEGKAKEALRKAERELIGLERLLKAGLRTRRPDETPDVKLNTTLSLNRTKEDIEKKKEEVNVANEALKRLKNRKRSGGGKKSKKSKKISKKKKH